MHAVDRIELLEQKQVEVKRIQFQFLCMNVSESTQVHQIHFICFFTSHLSKEKIAAIFRQS